MLDTQSSDRNVRKVVCQYWFRFGVTSRVKMEMHETLTGGKTHAPTHTYV